MDGGPLPMAQVPIIPPNINLLDFMYDIDDDCDVLPIKRTRATHKGKEVEGESSNPQIKKKAKEFMESQMENPSKRCRSRRKINMEDMPMGKGVEPFDLKQEFITNGPRITWPQLLQLSPKIRKEWGRLTSIHQSTKTVHYAGVVRVKEQKDIRPVISVTMKGLLIKDALVNSGIRIRPSSNVIVSKIGNPICQKSSNKVDMVDKGLVPCLGAIEDKVIDCFGMSISMDLHVILLKGSSCSLVLVRPWMQELHVIHDWSIMNLSPSKGFNIIYDLYLQQLIKCIKKKESSINNGKQEEESITIDVSSWDRENKSFHVVSTKEEVIEEKSIITLEEKENMISNDIQVEEYLRFISLLSKFPKLLINVYSQIKGEDGIKHHIKVKESVPIAQMLQQFEVVQKEDHKALLQESFIYNMEDLKCVSPIVVVPKKNEIYFKPLIDSTKRDQFLLPFRDEIVDEIVVYTKQGSVENVVCQEGIHVESRIEVIQKATTPTSLKALKVFVQKVRLLERFIHMLTCLLLSRVMYRMALLVFGELA